MQDIKAFEIIVVRQVKLIYVRSRCRPLVLIYVGFRCLDLLEEGCVIEVGPVFDSRIRRYLELTASVIVALARIQYLDVHLDELAIGDHMMGACNELMDKCLQEETLFQQVVGHLCGEELKDVDLLLGRAIDHAPEFWCDRMSADMLGELIVCIELNARSDELFSRESKLDTRGTRWFFGERMPTGRSEGSRLFDLEMRFEEDFEQW